MEYCEIEIQPKSNENRMNVKCKSSISGMDIGQMLNNTERMWGWNLNSCAMKVEWMLNGCGITIK